MIKRKRSDFFQKEKNNIQPLFGNWLENGELYKFYTDKMFIKITLLL